MSRAPERIICLSAESADWLWRIGARGSVVGVTAFFPQPPGAPAKPRVGEFSTARVNEIVELNRDLVIKYFVNLKEWTDKDGGRIYTAGFTNQKGADVMKEFGTQYSYKDESGQKRPYLSVSQFKLLWPDQKKNKEPGGPGR